MKLNKTSSSIQILSQYAQQCVSVPPTLRCTIRSLFFTCTPYISCSVMECWLCCLSLYDLLQMGGEKVFQQYGRDDSESNLLILWFELNKYLIAKDDAAGCNLLFGHQMTGCIPPPGKFFDPKQCENCMTVRHAILWILSTLCRPRWYGNTNRFRRIGCQGRSQWCWR